MNACADHEAIVAESLAAGRGVTFVATGTSMEPLLPAGSLVRVAPCLAAEVRRGQVVACRRPDGGVVLHRAVATGGGRVVTWGDSLAAPDPWRAADVVGRVSSVLEAPVRPLVWRAFGAFRGAMHLVRAAVSSPG